MLRLRTLPARNRDGTPMRPGASSTLVISSLVFEYGCDAMILLDSELTVRALNPAAQALLGWRSDAVVNRLDCRTVLGCPTEPPRPGSESSGPGNCLCDRVMTLHRAVESATLRLRPHGRRLIVVSASCSPVPVDHLGGAVLVLRASEADQGAGEGGDLCFAELRMNVVRHQVFAGNRTIHLTPLEFSLLRYLLAHAGRVISHQELLEHVWRYQDINDRDLVKSHIGSLRHRLRDAGVRTAQIQNVYAVGYVLTTAQDGPPGPEQPVDRRTTDD